jgi:serine/threonine-protein kinase HipA
VTERVEVRLNDAGAPRVVGELVDVGTGPHFEYAPSFLSDGVELSPFGLARRAGVFTPGPMGLHRLQGLFFDALPDGWGLKMLHQAMRDAGVQPSGTSAIAWLRALGTRGMGALTFHPPQDIPSGQAGADLETLAANAQAVDAGGVEEIIPALARAGGTSGGARPKLVAGWKDSGEIVDAFAPLPSGYRPVLIKFASSRESADAPRVEAAYLTLAEQAGLRVAGHRVHQLVSGRSAIVVDRFDRVSGERRHVHTLAGLLEVDIRVDLVEYETLLNVAIHLTNDLRVAQEAWLRAVFNVAAHNRDDHARNIAFLMEPDGTWQLAPAYDLTFAEGPGGFHTMSVDGESRDPTRTNLLALGERAGFEHTHAALLIDRVRDALDAWPAVAAAVDLRPARIAEIGKRLKEQSKRLK